VVTDDGGARAVIDLELDIVGDLPFGIADGEVAAAQGRALPRLDTRRTNPRRRLVTGDLRQLQSLELLALRPRQRCRRGPGPVLGDELLQVSTFRLDILVRAFLMQSLLTLKLEVRIDLAGERRQLAACQVEGVIAGGAQEGSIV